MPFNFAVNNIVGIMYGGIMNTVKLERIKSRLKLMVDAKRFEYFLLALAVLGACVAIFFSFNGAIWADEAYSLRIIQYSYADIIKMSAADVHPPLYYLMLKLTEDVFGIISRDYYFTVVVAKLFSILPYILLGLLIWKKYKGLGTTRALMLLCLFGMPQLINYAVEIRMYSWGLFFISASFIYASDILSGNANKKNWVLLVTFSVLAAYTHTFALVAMASVWLYFIILTITCKRELLKKCFVCAAAVMICFLPWFVVLLRQVGYVTESYWIPPIESGAVTEYTEFIFGYGIIGLIFFVLLAVSVIAADEKKSVLPKAFGVLVPITTILIGVAASIIIRPVFISRYIVPGLMCLWISFLLLQKNLMPFVRTAIAILLVTLSVINVTSFAIVERDSQVKSRDSVALIDELEDDCVIVISCNGHVADTVAAHTPEWVYNWRGADPATATQQYSTAFTNKKNFNDINSVYELLEKGVPVYYFEVYGANDYERIPDETKEALVLEYKGDYNFQADLAVYRLYLK